MENFNYVSFGNWDYLEGNQLDLAMSRGRMFEYTPTDIEKRLEGFGPTSIEFLERLPTFLCSEILKGPASASMIIKYGRIEQTRVDKKEVFTRFVPLIDFGEVEFKSIEEAKELFGADGFQLYRTHWAVRSGDFRDILSKIAQAHPEFADVVARHLIPDGTTIVAEPPAREKNIIGIAESVETFLGLLYGLSDKESTENFYRGHEDESFELTPSLLRKWPDGAWKYMPNEDRLCKELLIAHYDEFQADQYCFDRLVRMQHYGLPTRLLDISGNPLVALFFACYCREELMNADGEVIVFRIRHEKVKYYDSDTVSCLSNLSNLTYKQKNEIDLGVDVSQFNQQGVALKLLHHIKSEKGYFEGRILPDDLGSIICVKAKRTNSRIKSQSGAFLLYGHEAVLPEAGNDGIDIARLTIKNKKRILSQLDSININATTVYPSIDQTTVHLRERYLHLQTS